MTDSVGIKSQMGQGAQYWFALTTKYEPSGFQFIFLYGM